jgi:cell division protein FtsB
VLVLIAVAAGIVYVWQQNRLLSMGRTVSSLRKEINQIKEERIKAEAEVFKLKRPDRILQEVKTRRLGLVKPQPGQVIHLDDPPPLVLADESDAPRRPPGLRLWDTIVLGER